MSDTIKLECDLMMAQHELNRCRGNALAFVLMSKTATSDDAKERDIGCVTYWDKQTAHVIVQIASIEQAIMEAKNA